MHRVALIEVREVHFNRREWNGLDDVMKRNAGEAVPRRIDDCAINVIDMGLKCVYQHALVIRLVDDDLDAEFGGHTPDSVIDE